MSNKTRLVYVVLSILFVLATVAAVSQPTLAWISKVSCSRVRVYVTDAPGSAMPNHYGPGDKLYMEWVHNSGYGEITHFETLDWYASIGGQTTATSWFRTKINPPIRTSYIRITYLHGINGTNTEGVTSIEVPYTKDLRCYPIFMPRVTKRVGGR